MGKILRIGGGIMALFVIIAWLIGGLNLGWTKTSTVQKQKDPVTEIEVNVYTDKFVPGVDFLAAGLVVSAFLIGLSFVFKKPFATKT